MELTSLISHALWPAVATFFIWKFQSDISSLLSALSKNSELNFLGVNVKLKGPLDNIPTYQLTSLDSQGSKYLESYESPVVCDEKKNIMIQLSGEKLKKTAEILVYHLANSQVNIRMLLLERITFPEQVKLLLFLNNKFKPWPRSDLTVFYDEWKKRYQGEEYSFDQFVNFLNLNQLISHNESSYYITQYGKEFLQFLIKMGSPLLR